LNHGTQVIEKEIGMENILLIDNDPTVIRVLRQTFAGSGFELFNAPNRSKALEIFRTTVLRAVILELCLPGESGPDLYRDIRKRSADVPILVLSSTNDELDKILLLELGADDYITKPFSPRELLARVRVAVRRLNLTSLPKDVFAFDDVVVNFQNMELFKSGHNIPVTRQELRVLRFFVHNPGRVVSDSELLGAAWGTHSRPASGTIKTHILRLRQKVENDPRNPLHLRTVHRAGYKFVF
jgi:DNA-binding response OmpR family regulator